MEIVEKRVKDLIPYERNPRKNDGAVEYVANSIKEFGFKNPIVIDRDGVIVAGHTRLKAAKRLGFDTVPCIIADDLTDEQIQAFRLADNKTAEAASWDTQLLAFELGDIDLDMEQFGFVFEEKDEDEEMEGEVPFTEVLGEENNYIVLKFNREIDWLQIETLFQLPKVKNYSTRKDGAVKKEFERAGIGRVVDGAEFLNKMGIGI